MQRIIYLSWPATEITGGIKMTFRHVEGLREAGFAAFVATADAQPPGWFETSAPVIKLSEVVPQTDVLVFPENHNELLEHFAAWPNPKAVFCQNQYMVFRGLGNRADYAEFGVQVVICVSQMTAAYCRRRFPALPVYIVSNYIDRNVFQVLPMKRLQIAFIPRKRSFEASFIHDLFRAENPQWRGIPWVRIHGASEPDVAATLGESAVYLSLCRFEAFSLTQLEGLACGCITAGFTGLGGRQMATAANGFWAEEDDCLDCVDQLTLAVRLATEGGDRLRDMVEAAVATAELYCREKFVASLTNCWKALTKGAQASPPE